MTHARRLETLSPEHSFVVQLRKPRKRQVIELQGRVEHVVSGEATRFTSLAELEEFMQNVMAAQNRPSSRLRPPSP